MRLLFVISWILLQVSAQQPQQQPSPPQSPQSPYDFYSLLQQHQQFNQALLNNGLLHTNLPGHVNPPLPPHSVLFAHHFPQQPIPPHPLFHTGDDASAHFFDHLMQPSQFTQPDGSSTENPRGGVTQTRPTQPPPTTRRPEVPNRTEVDPVVEVIRPNLSRTEQPVLPMFQAMQQQPLMALNLPPQQQATVLQQKQEVRPLVPAPQRAVDKVDRDVSDSPPEKEDRVRKVKFRKDKRIEVIDERPREREEERQTGGESEFTQIFKEFNLSDTDKKDIVHHVEELLKEEIAKKLVEAALHPTISTAAPTTRETTQRPMATLRIREQKEIRESQPRVRGVKLLDRANDAEEDDKDLFNAPTPPPPPPPPSLPDIPIPLHTADAHLSFPISNHQSEEDEGRKSRHRNRGESRIAQNPESWDRSEVPSLSIMTGAPLDLSEAELVTPSMETEAPTTQRTTTEQPTTTEKMMPMSPVLPRMRNHPHVRTAFEQLASDYRSRLEGSQDVSQLLKNFYENAYIALIENKNNDVKRSPPRAIHPNRFQQRIRRQRVIEN